jgi:hypothetical protein
MENAEVRGDWAPRALPQSRRLGSTSAPMRPSKWDLVLEKKPIPMLEHLMDELARLLAAELSRWPPEIEAANAGGLPEIFAAQPDRPQETLYREAFALARWDLSCEHAAFDDYFRNRRYLAAGLAVSDKALLLAVSRLIIEQLLALGEATEGRLKRHQLLELLERTRSLCVTGV